MGLLGTTYPGNQNCEHAIDFFEQFTSQLFLFMKEQPYVAKMFVLMADAQRSEGTPENVREIAMQVNTIEQFVPIIEWGQKEETIKKGDPLALSNAFWCSIQGIAEQYASHPEMGLPDAEWIVDIVKQSSFTFFLYIPSTLLSGGSNAKSLKKLSNFEYCVDKYSKCSKSFSRF